MSPADVIRAAQMDGVALSLSASGTIKASGDGTALNRWLAVFRERKAELVRALGDGASEQTAPVPAPKADAFIERRDRLCGSGLNQDKAGLMAWKLERRDVEGDERRLCIECRHLSGGAGS